MSVWEGLKNLGAGYAGHDDEVASHIARLEEIDGERFQAMKKKEKGVPLAWWGRLEGLRFFGLAFVSVWRLKR